jgi:hypothetical protein
MGYTAGATNPDIQLLVDALLGHTIYPAIAHAKEERVVDAAWEARGEKEGETQKCGTRHSETQREGETDHETVMKPVIEPQRSAIHPDMIEVEGKTEIGREPVGIISIEVFKIRHSGPEIGRGDGDNQRIVDRVDCIVRILESAMFQGGIHERKDLEKGGGEQDRNDHLTDMMGCPFNRQSKIREGQKDYGGPSYSVALFCYVFFYCCPIHFHVFVIYQKEHEHLFFEFLWS